MPIVLYLGQDVKEYKEKAEEKISRHINEGGIRCDNCTKPMSRHSAYERGIKETGEKLRITVVRCKACGIWHALLPDFLLPHKQYSGNEIEGVIIDSAEFPVAQIDTEASESTVRRWIAQIGVRITMAIGVLKYMFMQAGCAISEVMIGHGPAYSELEQVLDMSPAKIAHTGNKLGLANMWLGMHSRKCLI